jgi:hypothetical protein
MAAEVVALAYLPQTLGPKPCGTPVEEILCPLVPKSAENSPFATPGGWHVPVPAGTRGHPVQRAIGKGEVACNPAHIAKAQCFLGFATLTPCCGRICGTF